MPLSKQYTLLTLWAEVEDGLDLAANNPYRAKRKEILNRGIEFIVSQFYDLLGTGYRRVSIPTDVTTSKYFTANASWNALLSRLTVTMDTGFQASDVGSEVVFHDGSNGYKGYIEAVVSATVVELRFGTLPTADIAAVDYVIMLPISGQDEFILLSNLRMMRSGQSFRITLSAVDKTECRALSYEAFKKWDVAAEENLSAIAYTPVGNKILLLKGDDLATYPAFEIGYPGLPEPMFIDANQPDIPDGAPIELAILYCQKLVRDESRGELPRPENELERIELSIRSLYRTFGAEVEAEAIKEKILAFK